MISFFDCQSNSINCPVFILEKKKRKQSIKSIGRKTHHQSNRLLYFEKIRIFLELICLSRDFLCQNIISWIFICCDYCERIKVMWHGFAHDFAYEFIMFRIVGQCFCCENSILLHKFMVSSVWMWCERIKRAKKKGEKSDKWNTNKPTVPCTFCQRIDNWRRTSCSHL